ESQLYRSPLGKWLESIPWREIDLTSPPVAAPSNNREGHPRCHESKVATDNRGRSIQPRSPPHVQDHAGRYQAHEKPASRDLDFSPPSLLLRNRDQFRPC